MSDQPSPPAKPKPGSLRDRIAAFEKPTNVPTPGPAPVPRPKPGAVSWKPRAPSPPSVHPGGDSSMSERKTGGMSASDAKESIGKGGSLRERMAALQGRGAFGAPPPPVAPKPAIERPKWKPPPPVASPSPDDRLEKDDVPRKAPEIPSKLPDSIPPQPSSIEDEPNAPSVAGAVSEPEEQAAEADPEDEERQRRAAIAARIARLGGARVGMGPPVFGKVPVKPKPKAELVEEEAKPVEVVSPPPPSGDDEVLNSAPTSPPLGEGAGSKALDVEQSDEGTNSEPLLTPPDIDASSPPARTPASMPVPAGPRRAAPPRRRPAKSPALPSVEDSQNNRESLDITSHPISDSEGASKEETLNVVTELGPGSLTEAAKARITNEELISPLVVEADVADIRVSPESPSFQGHIDLPEASMKTSEPSQELGPDDISEVPVEEHLSPAPEPSVPFAEEKEDEEARHKRVAERIAKMGGINPFVLPSLQRKSSTTSNVSDVIAPQSPTVQKRASVGSISKSPERKLSIRKPSIDEAPVEEESSFNTTPPRRRSSQFSENSPAMAIASPPTRTRSVDSATSGEQIHAGAKRRSQDDAIPVQGVPEPRFPIGITEEPESYEEEISARGVAAVEVKYQVETNWDAESIDDDQGISIHDEKASPVIEDQDKIDDKNTRLPQLATSGPPPPLPASSTRPSIPAPEPVATLPLRRLSIQRVDDNDIVVVSPKRTSISPPLASTTEVEDSALFAAPPQRSVPPPPSVTHDSPISPTLPLQIPPPRSFSILPSQATEEDDETEPLPHPGPFRHSIPAPQRSLSQSSDQSEIETPSASVHPHPHRSIPPVPAEEVESDQEAIPLPPPPPRRPSPALEEQPLIIPPPVRRESIKVPPGLELRRRPHTPPMLTPTVSVSDHSSEQEILDEEEGDPIDPTFHSPSRRASYNSVREQAVSIREPASPSASVSSYIREPAAPSSMVSGPATATLPAHVIEPASIEVPIEMEPEQERRRTIAERMAKLGGIKFGAPPIPTSRPPPLPQRSLDVQEDAEGNQQEEDEPESVEEVTEEQEERARKERIAAKLISMGGMRIGMMPMGVGVLPSSVPCHIPPHPPVRAPPMPRAPPPTETQETDSEQGSQATSDDVVKVEAEESEAEEIQFEEADEVPEEIPPPPIPTREGRRTSVQRLMSTEVPPASSRIAMQSPTPLPPGRPPVPIAVPPRRTSVQTVTSIKSSYGETGADPHLTHKPQYDFIMVDEPEAQDIPPKLVTRPPRTGALPPPPPFSDNTPSRMELSDSISSQWVLPSIPSSSLEFGSGATMSVSWTDDVAETATAIPAPAPAPPEIIKPSKSQEDAVLTSEELMAIWGRIGVQVCEVATSLYDKSKKALIGDGSYHGFIEAVLHEVPGAAPPSPPSYGYVMYMQTGSSVQKRAGDIMPGDVVWLSDAKLKGHKGIQTYSQHVGAKEPLVGIVSEFEVKKFKLRVFQANQHVGQQTVESVSYRLEDMKSGVVKVFRILEA